VALRGGVALGVVEGLRAVREGVHRRAHRRGERQPDAQLGVVDRCDGARALVSAAALPARSEEHPEVRRPLGSCVRRRDGDDVRERVDPACGQLGDDRLARVHCAPTAEPDEPVGTCLARTVGRGTHRLDGHVRKDAVERPDDGKARHRPRTPAGRDEQRRRDPRFAADVVQLRDRACAEADDSQRRRLGHSVAVGTRPS